MLPSNPLCDSYEIFKPLPPFVRADSRGTEIEMSRMLQFKVVLLGEAGVGKSNVVLRFAKDEFQTNSESTIGAAFLTQTISVDETSIKFEIWDTAGQERFNSLAPMYYRGAHAALVVYDITKESTFDRAKAWVTELHNQDSEGKMTIALLGNKCDLDGRVIATETAEAYARDHNLLFLETSAKANINIREAFEQIGRSLPHDSEDKRVEDTIDVSDSIGKKKKDGGGGCCK